MLTFKNYILNEKNYKYIFPKDKEQILYDFYFIEFIDNIIKPSNIAGSKKINNKQIFITGVSDKTIQSFYNLRDQFLIDIKNEFLYIVFEAILHEFLYASDKNNDLEILYLMQKISPKITNIFRSTNSKNILIKKINNIKLQKDFVQIAKNAFLNLNWAYNYGGQRWVLVTNEYEKLLKAKTNKDIYLCIDRIYDLQHNTGTIFNKLDSYNKSGYHWIKQALDFKSKIINPWDFYDKCSNMLKNISAEILKGSGYGSLDLYQIKNAPLDLELKNNIKNFTGKVKFKNDIIDVKKCDINIKGNLLNIKNGIVIGNIKHVNNISNVIFEGDINCNLFINSKFIDGNIQCDNIKDSIIKNGNIYCKNCYNTIIEDGVFYDGNFIDGIWNINSGWMNGNWISGKWNGGWIYDPNKIGNYKDNWIYKNGWIESPINPKDYFKNK